MNKKSLMGVVRVSILLLLPVLLLAWRPAGAQQEVEFQGSIPVAPTGLEGQALPRGPFHYHTAEGMDIRVDVLARGIEYPTSMAFLPFNRVLVTTRPGRIRLLRNGRLQSEPVRGGPEAFFRGESGAPGAVHGYIDIALHPDFAENRYIYLSYTKPLDGENRALAIGRGVWNGNDLADFEDIWLADPGVNGPGRIAFAPDKTLYITASGQDPQDLSTLGGKVLRINADGSIPEGNPFVGRPDTREEIFSYGHRGSLGLAVHPVSGNIWQNENGPNGGDEINIIRPGANYGWPIVSLGRTYQGPWQSGDRPSHEDFAPPIVFWMPAIAVSGMAFYTGDALPAWKGDVFVGSLRTGEIPGTGHIERILFNAELQELRRESLLSDLRQRVRDIRMGPDELIYLATDARDGAILRLSPAQ